MANLFSDPTKSLPKQNADSFIVRTPMTQNDIGGQKAMIPSGKADKLTLSHVSSNS